LILQTKNAVAHYVAWILPRCATGCPNLPFGEPLAKLAALAAFAGPPDLLTR
jgi:hypothetical protein